MNVIIQDIMKWVGFVPQSKVREAYKAGRVRSFGAANVTRITNDWSTQAGGANYDVRQALVALRTRARDLEHNNATAKKFLSLCRKNIAGAYGFKLLMKIQNGSGPDKFANRVISEGFADWSKRKNCTVTGQMSFRDVQHYLITSVMRDGEYLVRKVHRKKSKYGFELQVLEPDLLDETYNARLDNGNVVIMGVELDEYRRPVAYHLKQFKPELEAYNVTNYSGLHRERVPASEIYHDALFLRAFQVRGVTQMHAAMMDMRQLSGYVEAALVNARSSAMKGGYFKTAADAGEYEGQDKDADGNAIQALEPGEWEQLPPGVEPFQVDPKYPDAQHEMFVKSNLRMQASGLDVSYMSLSGDLNETSWSSGRIGLLDERETWMTIQEWVIESFLERVFEDWLDSALMTELSFMNGSLAYYNKPYFIGRRWGWVDPEKDSVAAMNNVRAGFSSPFQILSQNGDDPEMIYAEIAAAQELAKKYGITLDFGVKEKTGPKEEPEQPEKGKKNGKAYVTVKGEVIAE